MDTAALNNRATEQPLRANKTITAASTAKGHLKFRGNDTGSRIPCAVDAASPVRVHNAAMLRRQSEPARGAHQPLGVRLKIGLDLLNGVSDDVGGEMRHVWRAPPP
jgi:hypothetical protein